MRVPGNLDPRHLSQTLLYNLREFWAQFTRLHEFYAISMNLHNISPTPTDYQWSEAKAGVNISNIAAK